jgi:hypothetical protein
VLRFDGRVGRAVFLRAAALRIALFVASIFISPLLLAVVVPWILLTGGKGGWIALLVFKPWVFIPGVLILFALSFVGISIRRARDAGMPALTGLFIPLLLPADYSYLVSSGVPWSFSAAFLFRVFPSAVLALYCVVILCILPSRQRSTETVNLFGIAGIAALGLGLYIVCAQVWGIVDQFVGLQPWAVYVGRLLRVPFQFVSYAMLALAAVLGWIAWQYRGPDEIDPSAAHASSAAPPIGWLLCAALVLAFTACQVAVGDVLVGNPLLGIMIVFGPIFLPTAAIYFLLLFAAWRAAVSRTRASYLLLLVAILPFLHWGYSHLTTIQRHRSEASEIAAIPIKPVPHVPATLVFEERGVEGLNSAWKVPEIQRTVSKDSFGGRLIQRERENSAKQSTVTSLPDEYLLLRVGQLSSFVKNGVQYSAGGGPFELRYVDSSHDDLIAIWWRVYDPGPPVVPVLTISGWFHGSNSITTTEMDARVDKFFAAALRKAS